MYDPKNRQSDARKNHMSSFRLSTPVFVSRCGDGAVVTWANAFS
jgi:hypothetical protein